MKDTIFDRILPLWKGGQTEMAKVIRWSKYVKANPSLRRQSTVEHSWSISFLGYAVISMIKPHLKFAIDGELLMGAITVHDMAEGMLGRDVLYLEKTEEKDRDEYLAFMEQTKALPRAMRESLEEAFLLQFALKRPKCFPAAAQAVMERLAAEKTIEASLFDAIERLDYLMYALECYRHHKDKVVIDAVFSNQLAKLDQHALYTPGFSYVWKPEDQRRFRDLQLRLRRSHRSKKAA